LKTAGAQIEPLEQGGWRLSIPAGTGGSYRCAQLDDYHGLRRRNFPWQAPFHLRARMRSSQSEIPGTWGLGLWNDPFGMALFSQAEPLRLPVLPQAAWFFFASPPNYLSLRDDLPACGGLAGVFRSPRPGWPASLAGMAATPLVLVPPAARWLRRTARRWVHQTAAALPGDPSEWREYEMDWQADEVTLRVDGSVILHSDLTPNGPLGLVIWVDNQFAAFTPHGRLRFGTLTNPQPAWIELDSLEYEGDAWQ
jgi:hypothetical protein